MINVYQHIRPVDILAIGVHPDDIELACAATLAKHIDLGYSVGIIDLTQGELGTRGSPELRLKESQNAAKILGVEFRANMQMRDGFFTINEEDTIRLIEAIRATRPSTVIANSIDDRHPDHGRAAHFVAEAFFYSGLQKIKSESPAYRAKNLYHFIQDKNLTPDFCVDVTGYQDIKRDAILAFSSQFNIIGDSEVQTPISGVDFLEFIFSKMRVFGRSIGTEYAEGFNAHRVIGVNDVTKLI